MTRHFISEAPIRSDSSMHWQRVLLALLGLGLILVATRAFAAPAVSTRSESGNSDRSAPSVTRSEDRPRPQESSGRSTPPGMVNPGHARPASTDPVRHDQKAPGKFGDQRGPVRAESKPHLVVPRPLPQCKLTPTPRYWENRSRDILAEIQWMSRRGSIPVIAVPDDADGIEGYSQLPAGWRAYGFWVPGGGKLHVRLGHSNEGWFNLKLLNKWGHQEKGMLQVPIKTGNPEVTYTNPSPETRAVFVVVDDPCWMSNDKNMYTLKLEKTWKSLAKPEPASSPATGVWAMQPAIKVAPEPPEAKTGTNG